MLRRVPDTTTLSNGDQVANQIHLHTYAFFHRSDSNKGSDNMVIFVSLISDFQRQNFKIWGHQSVKNYFFHTNQGI